jgi:Ran GTPase-activating protein (RanGAP) involved in mRNA processing and transport
LKKLKRLALNDNRISADGLAALVTAPFFRQLEELNLRNNPLGVGIAAFAQAKMPHLKKLHLNRCDLNADALTLLAHGNVLATVEELVLDDNALGDAGMKVLAQSPLLQNLITLNLNNCVIRLAGSRALAQADLPKLRALWLNYNPLTSTGIVALAKATWLNNLYVLGLGGVSLNEKAAQALANVRPMKYLQHLTYSGSLPSEVLAILKKRFKGQVHF